jgi:hypothetical protein
VRTAEEGEGEVLFAAADDADAAQLALVKLL